MASWLAEFPLRTSMHFISTFDIFFLIFFHLSPANAPYSNFLNNFFVCYQYNKRSRRIFMRQPLYLFPILLHRRNIDQRQLLRPVLQAGCQRRSGI